MPVSVVALVPAYNEEATIHETIESLLAQTYPIKIVVLANGCSDRTAEIARRYPISVEEYGRLTHKKSEAMNRGWHAHAESADLVLTVDADTVLVPTAVEEWVAEFVENPLLAGSCARFTMSGKALLVRLQRMDFSMGIDISLRRGWTGVLAGAGSCFRNHVLHQISNRGDGREGPWTYESAVEDFEVTYQARRLGYESQVSPSVRAYTDAMRTWQALRGQRMKWQTGTIQDLMKFGLNRTTFVLWCQQLLGWGSLLILMFFILMMSWSIQAGEFSYNPIWLIVPAVVWLKNLKHANRIPDRDWIDIAMAASMVVYELFSWVRMAWFISAWVEVVWSKMTRRTKDRWQLQYQAENNH